MPRRRKDCPICRKRPLKILANHFADLHELSIEEGDSLISFGQRLPLDLETILTELYKFFGNTKKQAKWYKQKCLKCFNFISTCTAFS